MSNLNLSHQEWGQKLNLFHFAKHSPGVVFWHPSGWKLFNQLVCIWREEAANQGFEEVSSPVLSGCQLWEDSGHLQKFKDNMFIFSDELGLKPMSCPGHAEIFKSKARSYQELPIRYSELGYVHRDEPSGSLNGLLRVRGFHQDDGHIFCMNSQVQEEVSKCLDMAINIYKRFNLSYRAELSGMPKNALGDKQQWEVAESELASILESSQIEWKKVPGEGAFYGPKIDLLVKDYMGREWQVGSIQLDYVLPKRFKLKYRDKENKLESLVMIHRASYGSLERFIAILLEHWQGNIPLEFAMQPLVIMPIHKGLKEQAEKLAAHVPGSKVSVKGSLGKRLALAKSEFISEVWILGEKENEDGMIARKRFGQDLPFVSQSKAIAEINELRGVD